MVINGVNIEEFTISGNTVAGMTGEINRYQEFLLNSNFDVITNFAAQQWATDLMLPILEKIRCPKIFVPTGFSGFYLPWYKGYFKDMQKYMRQYQMNVFLSEDYWDINFARDNGIEKIMLIPNGAGADEFSAPDLPSTREGLGIPKDHLLLLHVGSHTGVKGHMEAIEIFEQAKLKNAAFLIVGNYAAESVRLPVRTLFWFVKKMKTEFLLDLSEYLFDLVGIGKCPYFCGKMAARFNSARARKSDGKRLVIQSMDRRHTVAAYQEADLFLFPSRIECSPLVLFECMASRTPFLTTDVGNSKEIVSWSGSGMVLPTEKGKDGYSSVNIKRAVKLLEKLCANKAEREAMAERGFKAWKERFTWEKITKEYETLYKSLQA